MHRFLGCDGADGDWWLSCNVHPGTSHALMLHKASKVGRSLAGVHMANQLPTMPLTGREQSVESALCRAANVKGHGHDSLDRTVWVPRPEITVA